MPLGSSQPLKFTGSAVHGGGSCQISVTYDKAPTANSVWKVIHSIHGGCPISETGNLVGTAELPTPHSYTFTIPNELPAGEAVLAWTWFNRIGNREMYMNCAPITITAGSKRRDEGSLSARNATQLVERDIAAYNSLPNMYVANTSKDCTTTVEDNKNIIFPNPGSSVEKNAAAVGEFVAAPACGDKNGGSAAGPSQPASPVISAPATSATAPAPTTSSGGSIPGGVFFPVPNPTVVAPSVTASATAAPVVSVPATNAPVQAPAPTQATTFTVIPTKPTSVSAAPPAGTGTVGGGSQLTGPCSTEGSWNCIAGTSFQRCASGSWSVAMAMAAGTQCTAGESASFAIKAIAVKRNVRFSGAHIRRHIHRS